jgi:glyoxylase-like metal-dependent hydrolase (beta-lactamase superfamily II)
MAVPALRGLFPEADVLGSKITAGTLGAEKAVTFFTKIDGAITESLVKSATIAEEHRPKPLEEMRIPVDTVIGEGDVIEVGDLRFNVLATPGHSDCSLSFHEPETGILIISDAAGYCFPDRDYCWPNYFTGYEAYMDSLRRLEDLEAGVLCLSHNAVIKGEGDVKAFFMTAIAATEGYHDRIISMFESGESVRDIAEQLGAGVFEKTQILPLDFFQKNCGILVKQSLAHAGLDPDQQESA